MCNFSANFAFDTATYERTDKQMYFNLLCVLICFLERWQSSLFSIHCQLDTNWILACRKTLPYQHTHTVHKRWHLSHCIQVNPNVTASATNSLTLTSTQTHFFFFHASQNVWNSLNNDRDRMNPFLKWQNQQIYCCTCMNQFIYTHTKYHTSFIYFCNTRFSLKVWQVDSKPVFRENEGRNA